MRFFLILFFWLFANSLIYAQCNINWSELLLGPSPAYFIQGVICTGEAKEVTPCAIFTIDGDTVKADSLGRFHYIYYLTYERSANHGTIKKNIVIQYKNQKIVLNSGYNKFYLRPLRKNQFLIRYETIYFPKH